ncbi:MAG: cytochrome c oxidase assembly protein [Acidimicrobiales bacterium]
MALLLPAASDAAAAAKLAQHPIRSLPGLRSAGLFGVLVTLVVAFTPPVWNGARAYEFIEAVQFILFAFAMPPLLAGCRPWLGRSKQSWGWKRLAHLEARRRRHPEFWRAGVFGAIDVALIVLWRTPECVDALARHRWLVAPEAVSLALAGTLLWAELVVSAPLVPRVGSPLRALLAALCLWATWISVYIVGFSHVSLYSGFQGGPLMGTATDQQVAAAVVWFGATCALVPVVFYDILRWLRSEEDPDAELRKLVRAARRSRGS